MSPSSLHAHVAKIPDSNRSLRWSDCLDSSAGLLPARSPLIGVIPGEGVGPEVVEASLRVLRAIEAAGGRKVQVETGGAIGREAERHGGSVFPKEVVGFCEDVFRRGGCILNGPGGGRYVYDLRKRFDLFFKISPVQIKNGLPGASPMKAEVLDGVDLLIVRENVGGLYQGHSTEPGVSAGSRLAQHTFSYKEEDVRRFLSAAARLAKARKGELTVVWKESGVPSISALWRACTAELAEKFGVDGRMVDVDLMAYRLMHRPTDFDVVAAPNFYGDVLADLAAVLLGARGLSYSGNYTLEHDAVYQTNHGAAYDLAGRKLANPAGQILSLAMLLRESLAMPREALAIENGLREVWEEGWRTADVPEPGSKPIGTMEMADRVAAAAAEYLHHGESIT